MRREILARICIKAIPIAQKARNPFRLLYLFISIKYREFNNIYIMIYFIFQHDMPYTNGDVLVRFLVVTAYNHHK